MKKEEYYNKASFGNWHDALYLNANVTAILYSVPYSIFHPNNNPFYSSLSRQPRWAGTRTMSINSLLIFIIGMIQYL